MVEEREEAMTGAPWEEGLAARDPPRVTSLGPVGPLPKWAELLGKKDCPQGS